MFFVGNVMIDSLLRCRERADQSKVLERLGVQPKRYGLVTLHRPSNVDNAEQLGKVMQLLRETAKNTVIVFPLHPRTQQRIHDAAISTDGVLLIPPLGYLDFLKLMSDARFVLTDSGGIQEETTVLGIPCLKMRDNTERSVTVEQGTNRLIGTDPDVARRAIRDVLATEEVRGSVPELWDGKASFRIVEIIRDAVS